MRFWLKSLKTIEMKYNPLIHHRRSIRLKGYDYSKEGAYFITICCQNRTCRFGKIVGTSLSDAPYTDAQNDITDIRAEGAEASPVPTIELNEYGQIAYNEWIKLAERFSSFELDVFQIMPNHMHAILVLKDAVVDVGATLAVAQNDIVAGNDADVSAGASPAPTGPTDSTTISDIIGAYKSLVANECLKLYKMKYQRMGKFWQLNYYEHIIRNEQSYQNISNYIINNPSKWNDDKFFKK